MTRVEAVRVRGRWLVMLAGVAAFVMVGASCGNDTDETSDDADDSADSDSAENSDDSDDSAAESTEPAGDTEAEESWEHTAAEYRGQNGDRINIECTSDGSPNAVWGTGTYTDDSSICTAAVHAGLITVEDGGEVEIEIAPGEDSYEGTEENGVTSTDYAEWDGSFTFPDAED